MVAKFIFFNFTMVQKEQSLSEAILSHTLNWIFSKAENTWYSPHMMLGGGSELLPPTISHVSPRGNALPLNLGVRKVEDIESIVVFPGSDQFVETSLWDKEHLCGVDSLKLNLGANRMDMDHAISLSSHYGLRSGFVSGLFDKFFLHYHKSLRF